jgi:hypothetical protein
MKKRKKKKPKIDFFWNMKADIQIAQAAKHSLMFFCVKSRKFFVFSQMTA